MEVLCRLRFPPHFSSLWQLNSGVIGTYSMEYSSAVIPIGQANSGLPYKELCGGALSSALVPPIFFIVAVESRGHWYLLNGVKLGGDSNRASELGNHRWID